MHYARTNISAGRGSGDGSFLCVTVRGRGGREMRIRLWGDEAGDPRTCIPPPRAPAHTPPHLVLAEVVCTIAWSAREWCWPCVNGERTRARGPDLYPEHAVKGRGASSMLPRVLYREFSLIMPALTPLFSTTIPIRTCLKCYSAIRVPPNLLPGDRGPTPVFGMSITAWVLLGGVHSLLVLLH